MDLKKYISNTYQTVGPFEGINMIEKTLLKHRYLVVIDNENNFHGVLTASDIIKHPHKIVIDCITKKESVSPDDTINSVLEKFYSGSSFVLPVMNDSNFIGVIEKNQVLKELEATACEMYDKSLISEKAKKYFLNNLSHEIRTPMNGILGFLDLVSYLDTDDFKATNENFSKYIRKSADHFLLLMSDLIELSLIQAGDEVNILKDNVDIVKMLSELKDFFGELFLAQNRKVVLDYVNRESSFSLYTDEKKLKQIMYHLVNNAIKFSGDNNVTYGFWLSADEKHVSFFVRNKDFNLDQKDTSKMFEAFQKQENIGNVLNFGLGIGLPLVKSLTELLEGNIEIETGNEEITFIVNIPVKQKHP